MGEKGKTNRYLLAARNWAIMSTIALPFVLIGLFLAKASLGVAAGVVIGLYVVPQIFSWLNMRRLIKGAARETMNRYF